MLRGRGCACVLAVDSGPSRDSCRRWQPIFAHLTCGHRPDASGARGGGAWTGGRRHRATALSALRCGGEVLKESASANPMMLVLDDLHDADVDSLQLLKFVARVAHDARLIMVGTYRDAEMRGSPERAAILPDLLRDATRLPLAGLSEDQ